VLPVRSQLAIHTRVTHFLMARLGLVSRNHQRHSGFKNVPVQTCKIIFDASCELNSIALILKLISLIIECDYNIKDAI
jgi:hypothetical protein